MTAFARTASFDAWRFFLQRVGVPVNSLSIALLNAGVIFD